MTLWNLVNPSYGPIALNEGVGFSLDTYLASLSDGFYFDFTKTDRHFQESTGSTLADDVGEAIGLALDQRTWSGKTLAQIVAEQAELLVPGSWTMSVAGGTSTAVEDPAGTLTLFCDGTNAARGDQSFATVVGRTYRVEATAATSAPSVLVGTSQGGSQNLSATGITAGTTGAVYFVATATTTWVRFQRTAAGAPVITAISCKLVPGNHAVQATGSLKGLRQTTGDKFDGTDDNNLTPYLAGAGNSFIAALVTVPASVSATQMVAGATNASGDRFYLSFNSTGEVSAGIGAQNANTIKAATDRRGTELVVGVSQDGAVVRLFDDAAIGYEAAQSGSIPSAVALRIGCFNGNGTAASFFGGSIKKIIAGRDHLTLARYLQIRNQLLAA